MKEIASLTLFLILHIAALTGQDFPVPDQRAVIHYSPTPTGVQFSATTPPLQQIAGAPAPFYSYYWEFGDGRFSFEDEPVHIYEHTGEYEVRLFLTNNYDDGKPPPTRPKKFYVNPSMLASIDGTPSYQPVIQDTLSLMIQSNHNPRPEEEMVCIITYKNQLNRTTDGRLYLFYNQRKFKQQHFFFDNARTHHGERRVTSPDLFSFLGNNQRTTTSGFMASATADLASESIAITDISYDNAYAALDEAKMAFRNRIAWDFTGLQPDEERHLFATLSTTPGMLADTNAIIHIRGIYVPEAGNDFEVFNLELEIVASHDPNHTSVSDTRVRYRTANGKELDYKVRFQNTGRGPAREVKIVTSVPPGIDLENLEILDYSPYCPICPGQPVDYSCLDTVRSNGSVTFFFHNIYLPGVRQTGMINRDSTRGYVKFRLEVSGKPKERTLKSRSNIFFDKNPPIRTNQATTHITGYVPGLLAGVDIPLTQADRRSFYAGMSLSPYKPTKFYYQPEVLFWVISEKMTTIETTPQGIIDSTLENRDYRLEVVPLQIRRYLTPYFSAGAGGIVSLSVLHQRKEYGTAIPDSDQKDWLSDLRPGIFGDINLGLGRSGLIAGLRYLYFFNASDNRHLRVYLNMRL